MSEDGFQAGEDEKDGSGIGVANLGTVSLELRGSREGCDINLGGDARGTQFLGVKIWLVERA